MTTLNARQKILTEAYSLLKSGHIGTEEFFDMAWDGGADEARASLPPASQEAKIATDIRPLIRHAIALLRLRPVGDMVRVSDELETALNGGEVPASESPNAEWLHAASVASGDLKSQPSAPHPAQKQYSTSTEEFHIGTPQPISMDEGMALIKKGLEPVRAAISPSQPPAAPEQRKDVLMCPACDVNRLTTTCASKTGRCEFIATTFGQPSQPAGGTVTDADKRNDIPGAKLHRTIDAQIWAEEYCRLNPGADLALMTCWFANAIMCGHDYAIRKEKAEFKNFHRSLCERFGYCHDELHWKRDQVSLEEHIASRLQSGERGKDAELCRQWFDAVQDLNPQYLELEDFLLAKKLYEECRMRVPSVITDSIAAMSAKGGGE